MYSPKIKEEFIPILYQISMSKRMPMTKLVNQIIRDYLEGRFQIQTEIRIEESKDELKFVTESSPSAET
jgi:hypothetical protein